MPNIRLIPVDFVVEHAKALKSAAEALPLRSLIEQWFAMNHNKAAGYHTNAEHNPVVLPGCILGRYRNNQTKAQMLSDIIHEIHRRMNIPIEDSRRAKRPEDVRQDSWTWPHVMRVMIRLDIITGKTNKATFGAMIEQVLGNKVKKNSIRRANYGNYSILEVYDYDLSDQDKEVIKEITSLFLPLSMPEK